LPRLPRRWNSKVIIPLFEKSYSFEEMLYNSYSDNKGKITADDSSHQMTYFAGDVVGKTISVDSIYRKIPAVTIEKQIDLAKATRAKVNRPIPIYETTISGAISTVNNRIIAGVLNSDNSATANTATISAMLSDTLFNDLAIEVVARNFKNLVTDTLWFDTLFIAATDTAGKVSFTFDNDSLFSKDRTNYIDSLEFGLTVIIRDTLREALTQDLNIEIAVSDLYLDSFYGRVNATGYLTGQEIPKSPSGADSIRFEETMATFYLSNIGNFDSVEFSIISKNRYVADMSMDTVFIVQANPDTMDIDISRVMANLPDSILFYIEAAMPVTNYSGADIAEELTIVYELSAPLKFTLPPKMNLRADNPTRFFIEDSLTRANLSRAQNGAEFDVTVTNHTPFQGSIILLIGNRNIFPMDSIEATWHSNYEYINDTLYYIDKDTQIVKIDTLAVIDIPPAVIQGGTIVSPGRGDRYYLADSSAVSLIGDTCWFLPAFHFINPDTNQVILKTDYLIDLKSYLNLLFDPSVFYPTKSDTLDSLDTFKPDSVKADTTG